MRIVLIVSFCQNYARSVATKQCSSQVHPHAQSYAQGRPHSCDWRCGKCVAARQSFSFDDRRQQSSEPDERERERDEDEERAAAAAAAGAQYR